MKIVRYEYDNENLIKEIGFLLGSDEWFYEHKQNLRRRKGKIFYLLYVDGIFVSMCSIYKNQITDVHTNKLYRNKGYANYLISVVSKNGMYAGSCNTIMINIFLKNGFRYYISRGKYRYYKK